jgi:hypothetical protein
MRQPSEALPWPDFDTDMSGNDHVLAPLALASV